MKRSGKESRWPAGGRVACTRITCGALAVLLLAGIFLYMKKSGLHADFMDAATLREHILRGGPAGPLVVILLIAGAVVFSPLPSAPVALAAGAVFGHTWGTVYILIGAEAGSLVAFFLARLLGYDIVHRWIGERPRFTFIRRQTTLMAVVFLSRLVPFISFDVVSYAAGLTPLAFWRFAVATLAGILPASFLLAHFGGELASSDPKKVLATALIIGSVTMVPIIGGVLHRLRTRKQKEATSRDTRG